MKIRALLILTLLSIAACSAPQSADDRPEPQHVVGIGGSGIPTQWLPALNVIDTFDGGTNATTVVFDSTVTPTHADRVVVSGYFNQAVTVLESLQHNGSSTWRAANGVGDAISANTQTVWEYIVQAKNIQIAIKAGATPPTVTELDIGLIYERAKPN